MRRDPGKISTYFRTEMKLLVVIALTGIVYNVGMVAGPWFEGQLAQILANIYLGTGVYGDMVRMVVWYILVILIVQGSRAVKRLEVRRFANNINRSMKNTVYRNLLSLTQKQIEEEQTGSMMTKAVADVDACVEGIRKFTTEIFDTGVVMVAYLVMLFVYDWKLSCFVLLFPPLAYLMAERLKGVVSTASSRSKQSTSKLNSASLERVSNALTYRVYGLEENRNRIYEESLQDYEQAQIRSNVLVSSVQPIYQMISMLGAFFILYYGGRNVLGYGWKVWDIAAFSTYMSCFIKLSSKTSKAAKLVNAVQKARVSWQRIKPYLQDVRPEEQVHAAHGGVLEVKDVSFAYPKTEPLFEHVSFSAHPGEIIGVTGEIACGKSTLGRLFLEEAEHEGTILFNGEQLNMQVRNPSRRVIGYMGHDPQLFSGTIEENIRMGDEKPVGDVLHMVRLDRDLESFEEGIHTWIGEKGSRLSGGQQARLALARTLYHDVPVLVLDDPFAAVDRKTEREIFEELREYAKDRIVILISHRLELFARMDRVLFMEKKGVTVGTHHGLMEENAEYRQLVMKQEGGNGDEEQ